MAVELITNEEIDALVNSDINLTDALDNQGKSLDEILASLSDPSEGTFDDKNCDEQER